MNRIKLILYNGGKLILIVYNLPFVFMSFLPMLALHCIFCDVLSFERVTNYFCCRFRVGMRNAIDAWAENYSEENSVSASSGNLRQFCKNKSQIVIVEFCNKSQFTG